MGEIIAIISLILQAFQSIFYSVLENKNIKPKLWMLIVFLSITIVYSIFTYSTPKDLLIIFSIIIFSVLMYITNVKLYKFGILIYNACNITYNVLLKLYLGIVLECTLMIFSIVGLIIYLKWLKKHPSSENKNEINDKIIRVDFIKSGVSEEIE